MSADVIDMDFAPAAVSSQATLYTQDMSGWQSIFEQVIAAGGSCTLTRECSQDGVTWYAAIGASVIAVGGSITNLLLNTSSAVGLFQTPKYAKFHRTRCSAYGSGSPQVVYSVSKRQVNLIGHVTTEGVRAHGSSLLGLPPRVAGRSRTPGTPYTALSADQIADLVTDLEGNLCIRPARSTVGGYSHGRIQSLATTNATSLKGTAGNLYKIAAQNNHATNVAYLKLYNKATAPLVGTDTPVVTYAIAAAGGRLRLDLDGVGLTFATGIAYAITGAAADADATAVAADQVTGSIFYN